MLQFGAMKSSPPHWLVCWTSTALVTKTHRVPRFFKDLHASKPHIIRKRVRGGK